MEQGGGSGWTDASWPGITADLKPPSAAQPPPAAASSAVWNAQSNDLSQMMLSARKVSTVIECHCCCSNLSTGYQLHFTVTQVSK